MERPRAAGADREPLPRDPATLPPLDADARSVLDAGLAAMSLDLTPEVLAAIDAQMRLLGAWGQHVNLTAIREPTEVARLHVLDSLTAVAPIRARIGTVRSLVDIGSGGGYPGIPLGLALDAGRISLVESVGRKARFLETVAAALGARPDGVDVIEVLPIRAEALAAGDRRGSWDVAAVRAVGTVAECAELGLPLVRIGGLLVCWKRERPAGDDPTAADDSGPGATLAREVDAARPIIGQLGGARPEVLPTSLPDTPSHRLVLVRKERATPARFPRSPASRGPARRAC